ncbi:MAG: 50S ribosomal protein L11 methyltransferase [Eubacteriales bacterium]|nr:50S ribosomal protein L11 methyltransferase [Eubacteriales bacterium]
MKFTRFEIRTTTEAEEILAYNLNEMGIEGVEIINRTGLSEADRQRIFADILPEETDDGISVLRFFVPEGADIRATEQMVVAEVTRLREFFDVGAGTLTMSEADDTSWKDKWKEHFKPFTVADILVTPTWIEPPPHDGPVIRIDPGTAFGTGLHDTTQLCLCALRKNIHPGCEVLDIGCGSGILSIAALKSGANQVTAVDIDPEAIRVCKENFGVNEVGKKAYRLFQGNLIEDRVLAEEVGFGRYDLITANLLAEIIEEMAGCFLPHLKRDGRLIVSGILAEKEDRVIDALKQYGFKRFESTYAGDWVGITAKR